MSERIRNRDAGVDQVGASTTAWRWLGLVMAGTVGVVLLAGYGAIRLYVSTGSDAPPPFELPTRQPSPSTSYASPSTADAANASTAVHPERTSSSVTAIAIALTKTTNQIIPDRNT